MKEHIAPSRIAKGKVPDVGGSAEICWVFGAEEIALTVDQEPMATKSGTGFQLTAQA
jgi:hypothetical protein